MRQHQRRVGRLGVVLVIVAAGVATLAGAGSAATTDETEGVTAKEVKLGYITPKTGVAGSTFKNGEAGFKACVGAHNADGGVNGRKITYEYYDDGQITNQQGVQDLVQNRGVFAVVNNSPFAFQGYQWLLDNGVPMVGAGYDGPEYGQPGNEDLISLIGNMRPYFGVQYSGPAKFFKQQGAENIAALGYKISASSTAAAANFMKFAVPQAGLNPAYLNTSLDFGTTDVAPQVLAMKEADVDGVSLPLVASTNFAVLSTAAQNNLQFKAAILATGYGQDLLDQPISATLGPEVFLSTGYAPVELKTKATKKFQSDLAKYADWPKDRVPDFGVYTGYIACDLTMQGLEGAGKNLTRQGFIDATKDVGAWDGAGLTCQPVDVSAEGFGQPAPTQCIWYVQVEDGKFVVANKGKPVSGTLIEETDQATTTTAAPTS